jgi:hypothetical protein
MVAPFAAPLALALLFQPCTGLPAQDAAQLREQGRYAQALELAQALTDPTQRAREVLETHYYAGDLAGALGAGLQGLEHAPRDRWLLWRSTRLATDMAAAPLALDLARRLVLEAAHMAGQPATQPDSARWWRAESETLLQEARQLNELRGQQVAARGRARWVALLVLGFLACAAGWGTQGSGPAQVTGRARV